MSIAGALRSMKRYALYGSFGPLPVAPLLLAGILLAAAPAHRCQAQDEEAAGPLKVTDVYEKTKSAKTIEDLARIIADCRTLQQTELSEANAEYLKNLLSYVQNRRGELYANQATEKQEQGETEAAAELDALALADFEAAVENDPKRWKAVHNRGVSYAVSGDYEKAIEDFTRTIALKGDYPNAWFNRAEIRYELGRFDEALADYTHVIELNRTDAGAYTSRGHTYFQLGRYDRALADYNRAVQIEPDSAVARADRGDAYRSLGRWQQASNDYREALRLDRNSSRVYQSAAWLMATCPESRYRNAQSALQAAQRAVELGAEEDYRLLDTLAAAYANAQQFEEAVQTQQRAIQLAPEDEAPILEQRLQLYQANQPYRQQAAGSTSRGGTAGPNGSANR